MQVSCNQYVVVNLHWSEISRTVFQQIRQIQPQGQVGRRSLGAGSIFSYLHHPREKLHAKLLEFLHLSEEFHMPVVVQIDGEQWWSERPDLWNWWDPDRSGCNPENRQNVEWCGWGTDHAIRIAWRNWGRQIRVLPPPNLMSVRYRDACKSEMQHVIPIILDWWRALPPDQKHLLIGIKVGWESSIGTGSFYYPNGNCLADRPREEDPTYGLKINELPGRGVAPIGYAAVKTAGLAESGELREEHLTEVIRRHLEDLCQIAAQLGVPRERLFTHAGGWKDGEMLYDAAVNRFSCPGWSFYRHARNPSEDTGVRRALQKSDAPFWGAVEWLPVGAGSGEAWRDAIHSTLSLPGCRYLCIYNWRGISKKPEVLRAIGSSLLEE